MSWRGNTNNPVPNSEQESINRGEEKVHNNRAHQVKRESDEQKNITIKLIDIDSTIIDFLESLKIEVTDEGNRIKVPLFYASPEKWKSIQKDGIIRDYNGKMILPAVVLKRTTSEKDSSMVTFNRYLRYPILKKYSTKNKYTQFSVLQGQNVPINDLYEVVMPDHMIFTYHFIIWTEYVEQMNEIVERVNFETEDYWGKEKGFKFRTRIDSFTHNIELQVDQDRIVKTEFDLVVYGYLLPDILDGHRPTTIKSITPKKVIVTNEVVSTGFDLNADSNKENAEKWRSKYYHNLKEGEEPEPPPYVFNTDIGDATVIKPLSPHEVQELVIAIQTVTVDIGVVWHLPAPTKSSDPGQNGWQSYDNNYYYLYVNGLWKRVPLALFSNFGGIF